MNFNIETDDLIAFYNYLKSNQYNLYYEFYAETNLKIYFFRKENLNNFKEVLDYSLNNFLKIYTSFIDNDSTVKIDCSSEKSIEVYQNFVLSEVNKNLNSLTSLILFVKNHNISYQPDISFIFDAFLTNKETISSLVNCTYKNLSFKNVIEYIIPDIENPKYSFTYKEIDQFILNAYNSQNLNYISKVTSRDILIDYYKNKDEDRFKYIINQNDKLKSTLSLCKSNSFIHGDIGQRRKTRINVDIEDIVFYFHIDYFSKFLYFRTLDILMDNVAKHYHINYSHNLSSEDINNISDIKNIKISFTHQNPLVFKIDFFSDIIYKYYSFLQNNIHLDTPDFKDNYIKVKHFEDIIPSWIMEYDLKNKITINLPAIKKVKI